MLFEVVMLNTLSNFQARAFFGTITFFVVIGAILLSHHHPFQYFFLLMLAFVQAIALWEYYHLTTRKGLKPLTWVGISFATAFTVFHMLSLNSGYHNLTLEIIVFLFAITSFICYFNKIENAVVNLSVTLFGFVYITVPLSLLIDLNYSITQNFPQECPIWLLFLIAATKMTDTFAYFAGKRFGKHKIAPILSPKKTVEGAIGGLIGAVATGACFFYILQSFSIRMWPDCSLLEILCFSFFLGIASMAGDLAESLLKRDAQVKDSNALPGFGGALDMVDSMLFTTPLLYLYLRAKILI
jgi:phosphatidate cytidylyltransferase